MFKPAGGPTNAKKELGKEVQTTSSFPPLWRMKDMGKKGGKYEGRRPGNHERKELQKPPSWP